MSKKIDFFLSPEFNILGVCHWLKSRMISPDDNTLYLYSKNLNKWQPDGVQYLGVRIQLPTGEPTRS